MRNRVEEIKTHRGDLARQPDNHRQLHWAQARVYAWLLCQSRGLAQMEVTLVYLDIDSDRQTLFSEQLQADDLQRFFETLCQRYIGWAQAQRLRQAERNRDLQRLAFPYPQFRQGQRQLAETLYKAVATGRCLMAQASTGIGKTLGTLFPLLKAMVPQQLDKLFFLTAKTTPGRALALDALRQISAATAQPWLRALELIARDKACEHPDRACHGESCPLAKGFYDRLPAAREAASHVPLLDRAALREVALAHEVCPYYLGQEMARWVDVVVADYNYYFDAHALLFGLTQLNQWRVAVLVDEAHNLVERGRAMYSASLDQGQLMALRQRKPAGLTTVLERLNRQWNALYKEQQAPYHASEPVPDAFIRALQQCTGVIQEHLERMPAQVDPQVLQFYFQLLQFTRVAELFDEHFLFDIQLRNGPRRRRLATLTLRNVVPARLLAPRMAAARSVTLFSADTGWLEVAAPFRAEQLQVHIVSQVSTRYQQRQRSLAPIVELIAGQYRRQPGNYLAFFSSFEYLQQVASLFAERHPEVTQWCQAPGMDEAAREAFLARFVEQGQGVGFAVLGGAFGEGVDLPGTRLIGAFVACHLGPTAGQSGQRTVQGAPRASVRCRLRLHLPVPGRTQGDPGGRSGDSGGTGSRRAVSDRRALQRTARAADVSRLVADRRVSGVWPSRRRATPSTLRVPTPTSVELEVLHDAQSFGRQAGSRQRAGRYSPPVDGLLHRSPGRLHRRPARGLRHLGAPWHFVRAELQRAPCVGHHPGDLPVSPGKRH